MPLAHDALEHARRHRRALLRQRSVIDPLGSQLLALGHDGLVLLGVAVAQQPHTQLAQLRQEVGGCARVPWERLEDLVGVLEELLLSLGEAAQHLHDRVHVAAIAEVLQTDVAWSVHADEFLVGLGDAVPLVLDVVLNRHLRHRLLSLLKALNVDAEVCEVFGYVRVLHRGVLIRGVAVYVCRVGGDGAQLHSQGVLATSVLVVPDGRALLPADTAIPHRIQLPTTPDEPVGQVEPEVLSGAAFGAPPVPRRDLRRVGHLDKILGVLARLRRFLLICSEMVLNRTARVSRDPSDALDDDLGQLLAGERDLIPLRQHHHRRARYCLERCLAPHESALDANRQLGGLLLGLSGLGVLGLRLGDLDVFDVVVELVAGAFAVQLHEVPAEALERPHVDVQAVGRLDGVETEEAFGFEDLVACIGHADGEHCRPHGR
mmetsp:Transcript_41853/g.118687  ORF Transcript_41853/g.118687 Transcript_41853/m.118687 type:complete len:432 (-) Transcript_41853:127-1422(-)